MYELAGNRVARSWLDRIWILLHDRRGLESLEYAVLAILLLGAVWGCIAALAVGVDATYQELGNWIVDQASGI